MSNTKGLSASKEKDFSPCRNYGLENNTFIFIVTKNDIILIKKTTGDAFKMGRKMIRLGL